MSYPKVIFMGTPDFAVPCLDMLIEQGYNVTTVVTQPDRPKGRGQKLAFSPVKARALEHRLNILQPENIKETATITELIALQPDLIVVVAFGQFLPKTLLDLPRLGCVNVHASLLPCYRGAAPIHWAIINGEKTTGITTMYMDIGMDTGDMILKAETPITPTDTTGQLHDTLSVLGAKVLKETISLLLTGKAPRMVQPKELATYAPLLTRDIEKINWNNSAEQINNLIRGLNPWPGAYCRSNDKNLKVWESRVSDTMTNGQPGKVHKITPSGIIVETGHGLVELLTVQPENKRRMGGRDFASGYGLNSEEYLS
ncbi:Methionyl-tRNA formyltransferase [bioreactor metagenome]|uniref:methionyl-tRNA formyltransferase n=1 Tax=bioreactor metagenome TaxID=1076179 RepID=A0A644T1Y3_9ZZZZ|nr:methionyl-tRNA formyltransferase [Negativicutes bacterium]